MSESDNCANKAPLKLRIEWKIDKFKRKVHAKRLRRCIEYITESSKDSNYVKHALGEMRRAWPEAFDYGRDGDNEMQKFMCDQIIAILSLLHTQGDSGSSIGYKMHLLNKLIHFGILSPLTFDEDEWGAPFGGRDTRQNKRCSGLFWDSKETNEKLKYHYIDGIGKYDRCFVRETVDGKLYMDINEHPGEWSGGAFVIRPDGTLRYSDLSAYVKDPKTFNPEKHFHIPTCSIEYPSGWWISFVREEDLSQVKDSYNIKYESKSNTEKRLEEEINFKDGKYADEIRKRIDFVIKYNTKPFKKTLKTYVNEQRSNRTDSD